MSRLALLRVCTLPFETLSCLRAERCAVSIDELLRLESELAADVAFLEQALYRAAGSRDDAEADPSRARSRLALVRLRRDVHNRRPLRGKDLEKAREHLDPEIVRRLDRYGEARTERESLVDACRRSIESEILRTRAELMRLAAAPLFEEGLFLASRELLGRVRALAGKEPRRWAHDERHVAAKTASYAARFCTKTSPNGVFCSTGLVEIGAGSTFVGGRPGIEKVDVILNVAEARKIAECLAIEAATVPVAIPRPNPTLREEQGGWTYWKPANFRNPTDEEVLSRAKSHPVLGVLLEEAGRGELRVPELLETVAARCGVAVEALRGFYLQAVERGILIAEAEIPYNSRRPLLHVASSWRSVGSDADWLSDVEQVESQVDGLADLDPAARIASMERIGAELERLPHLRPLRHDELFRLDAATGLRVRLPQRVLQDLRTALRPYVRLFSAMYPTPLTMNAYSDRFLQICPADTDVPLLDLYHGFVEADDYRRPVAFPEPAGIDRDCDELEKAREAKRRLTDHLAERALRAAPGEEIEIDEDRVRALVGDAALPRWACGVLFQIAARDAADIDRAGCRLVLSGLFNGIGLALARFAHLHGGRVPDGDNPIPLELLRHWRSLEREGAVVAELTYNHVARTANAGLRPSIFPHEIELPGDRSSPDTTVIPLRDLLVRYDSTRNRIGLFWKTRGVEVLPVISSGVSPMGLVSFLVAIGQRELQYLGLFPGFDAEGVKRWPRVVSGPLVLLRARWIFGAGEWPPAPEMRMPFAEEDHFLETARWRRRHDLPRHVFVHSSEEPKPRYVDLESPVLVDLLRRTTARLVGKADATLHVTEMLPSPEERWIRDERGRYASEILIQMQHPDLGESSV